MKISAKGLALLDAIEAGLIRESEDGNGYDIAPFLRFWESFSKYMPEIKEYPDEIEKLAEIVKKYRK